MDELRQGILVVDGDLRVRHMNLALRLRFPLGRLEVGQVMEAEDIPSELHNIVQRVIAGSSRADTLLRLPQPKSDTPKAVFRLEAVCLRNSAYQGGALVMVDDITDQVQADQVRKDFVTNASHELRTPLALIHGYLETLQSGLVTGAASTERCLEVMDKHCRRMMRIIEDMLTISRLESVDLQLQMETFSVRSSVEAALENVRALVEQTQPQLRIEVPEALLMKGDRFYWDQIFTNLLENALKQNPTSGLQITLTAKKGPDQLSIRIHDNGVGIPLEDQPFVFKRFFRCAKSHSQEIKGTGLGLSIVRRAVEAHRGTIELHSVPQVETAFTITVPRG